MKIKTKKEVNKKCPHCNGAFDNDMLDAVINFIDLWCKHNRALQRKIFCCKKCADEYHLTHKQKRAYDCAYVKRRYKDKRYVVVTTGMDYNHDTTSRYWR